MKEREDQSDTGGGGRRKEESNKEGGERLLLSPTDQDVNSQTLDPKSYAFTTQQPPLWNADLHMASLSQQVNMWVTIVHRRVVTERNGV